MPLFYDEDGHPLGVEFTVANEPRFLCLSGIAMPGVPKSWEGVDGYGKGKVPTAFKIRLEWVNGYNPRWHRVYATAYSNASSLFVEIGRKAHFLNWRFEQVLEEFRDH